MYEAYVYPKSNAVIIEDTVYFFSQSDGVWSINNTSKCKVLGKKDKDPDWELYDSWEVEENNPECALNAWTSYTITMRFLRLIKDGK